MSIIIKQYIKLFSALIFNNFTAENGSGNVADEITAENKESYIDANKTKVIEFIENLSRKDDTSEGKSVINNADILNITPKDKEAIANILLALGEDVTILDQPGQGFNKTQLIMKINGMTKRSAEIRTDTANQVEQLRQQLKSESTHQKSKEVTVEANKEELTKVGQSIIGMITPKNLQPQEEGYNQVNTDVKTSELGSSNQFNLVLNEYIKSDADLINFFTQIPIFSGINNINELHAKIQKLGNKKVVSILEEYIDPEIGVTTATLFANGPKASLGRKIDNISEIRKAREIVRDQIRKEIESYPITNNFYEGPVINGSRVLIHTNAKNIFAERVANDIVIKNKGNISFHANNIDGFTGVSTGIGVNEIFNKLGINPGTTLKDYFSKFGSTLTLTIGKNSRIGFIIYNGNLITLPITDETKFDVNGFVSLDGVGVDGDLNTKVGKFSNAGVGVGATLSFKGGFVVGPYVRLGTNINEKVHSLHEEATMLFMGKILEAVKAGKSYDKNEFTLYGKINFTEEEYNNLKEVYKLLGEETEGNKSKQNDLFKSFIKEMVIDEVVDEFKGVNFSGARVSLVDPHLAAISFITSLFGGVKIIGRGIERTDDISFNNQSDSTQNIKGFDDEAGLMANLEGLGIEFKDGKMVIPESWEVYGDNQVQINDGWFSKPVIGGKIKSIKLLKIIGEDSVSKNIEGGYDVEANVKYRLILNGSDKPLKESNKVEKLEFVKVEKPVVIPTSSPVVSEETPVEAPVETPVKTPVIVEQPLDSSTDLSEIDYADLKKKLEIKKIDVNTFRNNPKLEKFWIALSKGDITESTKYSKEIVEITGITNFSKLTQDKKEYVIDYLASCTSKFDNTEVKMEQFNKSGLLDEKNNIIIKGLEGVKFSEGKKYPFIYEGAAYGVYHLIKKLNIQPGTQTYKDLQKLHYYNIEVAELDKEGLTNKTREQIFNNIGSDLIGADFSGLHNQLVAKFEGQRNDFKSEFVEGVIGFTFKSSLDNKGKQVYKGLGHFSKGVSLVSKTGNWKNEAIEIKDNNRLNNIIDKLDGRQLRELKKGLKLDVSSDSEIKGKLKELIAGNKNMFNVFLAKDNGFDDTVLISINKDNVILGIVPLLTDSGSELPKVLPKVLSKVPAPVINLSSSDYHPFSLTTATVMDMKYETSEVRGYDVGVSYDHFNGDIVKNKGGGEACESTVEITGDDSDELPSGK